MSTSPQFRRRLVLVALAGLLVLGLFDTIIPAAVISSHLIDGLVLIITTYLGMNALEQAPVGPGPGRDPQNRTDADSGDGEKNGDGERERP